MTAPLDRIRAAIERAKSRRRRDFGEVTLVAVTKTRPLAPVLELVDAGQLDLAENRVENFLARAGELRAARPAAPVRLHFIGPLQRNKVGKLLRGAPPALVQSVDSLPLAESLARASQLLDRSTDILLEVKVSFEEAKHGIDPADLLFLSENISRLPNLRVRGLMAMAPFCPDPGPVRAAFDLAADLFAELKSRRGPGGAVDTLSLGMSGDFEAAVEAGSTMVRIGTALFA